MAKTATHECLTMPLWPDTARLLGLGKDGVYRAAHEGVIPVIRVGRRMLVPRAAFQKLLETGAAPKAA